jgi:hypothetical protein
MTAERDEAMIRQREESGRLKTTAEEALARQLAESDAKHADTESKWEARTAQLEEQHTHVLREMGRRQSESPETSNTEEVVMQLETVRREMKEVLLATKEAMLGCVPLGLPTKNKLDSQVPQWFSSGSWSSKQKVPWNSETKQMMTPAEGVAWLQDKLEQARAEAAALRAADRGAPVEDHRGA